jgi:hypothetical protein
LFAKTKNKVIAAAEHCLKIKKSARTMGLLEKLRANVQGVMVNNRSLTTVSRASN